MGLETALLGITTPGLSGHGGYVTVPASQFQPEAPAETASYNAIKPKSNKRGGTLTLAEIPFPPQN